MGQRHLALTRKASHFRFPDPLQRVYPLIPLPDLATVAALALSDFCGTLVMIAAYRAAPPLVVAPAQYSQTALAALVEALFFAEPMTASPLKTAA